MQTDPEYFRRVRSEIAPLLPVSAARIVDIGCGAGATLAWLRRRYPEAQTVGLEGDGDLEAELRRNAGEAHIVDLARGVPDLKSPDLILLLDVLEHLPDPLSVLRAVADQAPRSATVIVSLPNVAHLSVALPLILRGEFRYRDAGILDRTHLRFFVRESALGLLADAGLDVDRGLFAGLEGPKSRLVDRLTLGRLRARLAKQLIMRASPGDFRGPGRVAWSLAPDPAIEAAM